VRARGWIGKTLSMEVAKMKWDRMRHPGKGFNKGGNPEAGEQKGEDCGGI